MSASVASSAAAQKPLGWMPQTYKASWRPRTCSTSRNNPPALGIGDRKRLEIARPRPPSLLLLDEVIAGLAPPDAHALIDLIRTLHRQGMTIILIEHIMRAAMELADRIIVLHHGEKIAEGPPSQVVRDPIVVEAYLGEPAVVFDTAESRQRHEAL
jgi:ABC-type multidrug transport system ATPase subunit